MIARIRRLQDKLETTMERRAQLEVLMLETTQKMREEKLARKEAEEQYEEGGKGKAKTLKAPSKLARAQCYTHMLDNVLRGQCTHVIVEGGEYGRTPQSAQSQPYSHAAGVVLPGPPSSQMPLTRYESEQHQLSSWQIPGGDGGGGE